MIEIDYGGKTYRVADDRLEEALTRAALHCGRPISDEEQQARNLRYAKIMAERANEGKVPTRA